MTAPRRVAIFGASSPVGIELARRLVAAGQVPIAVTRGEPPPALATVGAVLQQADVLDAAQVGQVFGASPPPDALVSLVGGRPLRKGTPPDWQGNRNLIDAAQAAGVRRIVLVTSIGAGSSRAAAPWIARLILGRFMALKTRAEDYLRESGLDWTILRPGHLTDKPPTGRAQLLEDDHVSGEIPRADVAALLQRVLDDYGTCGRTYAALAPTGGFSGAIGW